MIIKDALKIAERHNHNMSNFVKKSNGVWIAHCKNKSCDCSLILDIDENKIIGSALRCRCGLNEKDEFSGCPDWKEIQKSPFQTKNSIVK